MIILIIGALLGVIAHLCLSVWEHRQTIGELTDKLESLKDSNKRMLTGLSR